MRLLFANIGWMQHYKGNCNADMIVGGGSWDNKDKHEAFNFQDLNGLCYGYVQAVGDKINLSRIDKSVSKFDDMIDKVLVVWVAKRPDSKGSYIVGWYNNATVYADYHSSNSSARNRYAYNIVAKKGDCVLLPVDLRTMSVPRATTMGKGFLGQSNVWYADYDSVSVQEFRDAVLDYVKKYKVKKNTVVKYQVKVDAKARKAVEEAAIKYVTKEYQKRGYEIVSREKDNIGWDLDATNGRICLKLEVKGVASSTISVHITHNEKSKMEANKKHYRLCVVINAIKNPQMIVFVWDNSLDKWVSEDDNSIALEIAEIPSYIASVV